MESEGSQSNLSSSDSPHDPCKMFIGGLSWQTTQEGLKDYFCKFGEVKESMVMRDPVTKRSRGFGFVTFVDQAGVDKVLAQSRHELDSKTEWCGLSNVVDRRLTRKLPSRDEPSLRYVPDGSTWSRCLIISSFLLFLKIFISSSPLSLFQLVTRTKKIFVGGLSVNTTIEDVKQYFDQFGKVDDAMLMFDKTTNRHRGKFPFLFISLNNCAHQWQPFSRLFLPS
uniref:RNA-binding protein Musashi homolog 1 n=1 Tax=Sinocyclocheilus grahami TaxID=75366 RepID=A0A672MQA8_SINGR